MISKKTKYALKALVQLAEEYQTQQPVLISQLAKRDKIPKKFLEVILLDLKNKGILASKKGKGGGYFLSKAPEKITLGSVMRLFEGPIALLPCVSQTAYQKCEECVDEYSCGIRKVMKEVRDAMSDILDTTTLKEVLDRSRTPEVMYHI